LIWYRPRILRENFCFKTPWDGCLHWSLGYSRVSDSTTVDHCAQYKFLYCVIVLCVCLSVYMYICLSVCVSVCLSICMYVCMSVCLSVCLCRVLRGIPALLDLVSHPAVSVHCSACGALSLFASMSVSVSMSLCMSVCLSVCLSLCLYVCLCVCLSV